MIFNLPLDSFTVYGPLIGGIVFFLSGLFFGVVLELAGFGDSRKLAAQFYFHDMRVLKTMFTGIIVACLLIFLFYFIGWMDFGKIFVNPTYLWPGVVGGLIMGVGFIVGGYCPGTSLVSTASLKLDGFVFFIGAIIGTGLFGETVGSFEKFWISSYSDRYLLSDLFNWNLETVVLAVTVMALGIFVVVEKVESKINQTSLNPNLKKKYIFSSGALLFVALTLFAIGEPSYDKKWSLLSAELQPQIDKKEFFIHPLEYVKVWNDPAIKIITLDLRETVEFNQFHLEFSENVLFEKFENKDYLSELKKLPSNALIVLVAGHDELAINAWKKLKVLGLANVYVLDQGIPFWKEFFVNAEELFHQKYPEKTAHGLQQISKPQATFLEIYSDVKFENKVKLKTTKKSGGLCG